MQIPRKRAPKHYLEPRHHFLFLAGKAQQGPFLKLSPSKANHLDKGKTSPLYMVRAMLAKLSNTPKKSSQTLGVAHYSPMGTLVLLQAGHQKQPCRLILGHSDSLGRRRAAVTATSLCSPVSHTSRARQHHVPPEQRVGMAVGSV